MHLDKHKEPACQNLSVTDVHLKAESIHFSVLEKKGKKIINQLQFYSERMGELANFSSGLQ